MKRILIILATLIILTGCETKNENIENTSTTTTTKMAETEEKYDLIDYDVIFPGFSCVVPSSWDGTNMVNLGTTASSNLSVFFPYYYKFDESSLTSELDIAWHDFDLPIDVDKEVFETIVDSYLENTQDNKTISKFKLIKKEIDIYNINFFIANVEYEAKYLNTYDKKFYLKLYFNTTSNLYYTITYSKMGKLTNEEQQNINKIVNSIKLN